MAASYAATIDGTISSGSKAAGIDLTGRSVGDLCFCLITRAATTAPATVPSGWSLLQSHASTQAVWLYYKILASGDLGALSWGWGSSVKTIAHAFIYTGADQTSPIDASNKGTFYTAGGQTVDFGAVTSSEGTLALFASAYSTSSKSYDISSLTAYTERHDHGHTDPDMWHLLADTNGGWGGGQSAPSTSTNYLSGSSSYRGGFHVAIKGAASSGSTAPLPLLRPVYKSKGLIRLG